MTQGFLNLQEPVWREGLTGVGQSWSGLLGWGSCTVSHAVGVQSKSQISLGYVLLPAGTASMDVSGSEELAGHLHGASGATRRI